MNTIKINEIVVANTALGCMRLTTLNAEKADTLVRGAIDMGVSLFDHADIYDNGESEKLFGKVLSGQPSLRDRMILQTKCGICKGYYDLSKEHILLSVNNSLYNLNTDHIDILLLHRPDVLMEVNEVAEAFYELASDGKVLNFGVSNMSRAQIAYLQKNIGQSLCVDQLQFSLLHPQPVAQGIHVNTADNEAAVRDGEILQYCQENNIAIQAWSPFQYGVFEGSFLDDPKFPEINRKLKEIADKYGVTPSAIALAWLIRIPAEIQVILGTTSLVHLQEACRGSEIQLSRQEWYSLYQAAGHRLP